MVRACIFILVTLWLQKHSREYKLHRKFPLLMWQIPSARSSKTFLTSLIYIHYHFTGTRDLQHHGVIFYGHKKKSSKEVTSFQKVLPAPGVKSQRSFVHFFFLFSTGLHLWKGTQTWGCHQVCTCIGPKTGSTLAKHPGLHRLTSTSLALVMFKPILAQWETVDCCYLHRPWARHR